MIELKHVSKTFDSGTAGGVDALKDVSLTIEDGDIYGIIGMSGAGKSTLVRCINLLEKPTSGEIIVNGQRLDTMTPAQLRAARREITMIFQRFNLLMQRTCLRNVCFPMELAGVKKAEAEQRARELLELVGLPDKAGSYPAQLSGGQQQRVALARALVAEPALLLLDEPLSNLDAKLRESMRFEIKDIQKQYGITVVYVTHDQTEAMAMSDRIVVINRGVIQQVGSPKTIYNEPANPFIADFVGKIEFLEGRVEAGYIALNGCGQKLPYEGDAKGDVIVGIRPEHVKYAEAGKGTLHGVVKSHFYLGDVDDCRIDLGDGKELRIIADPYESIGIEAGKAVELDVRSFLVYPAEQPGEDFRRILT